MEQQTEPTSTTDSTKEEIILNFSKVDVQYVADDKQQSRSFLSIRDLSLHDRLINSKLDKLVGIDPTLRSNEALLVIIVDRFLNTKSLDMYKGSHVYAIKVRCIADR